MTMAGDATGLTVEMAAGQLRLGPRRMVLLQPQVLLELQKSLEDHLGSRAGEYFYTAGHGWAVGETRRLKTALVEEGASLAGLFCSRMGEMGWGQWRLAGLDREAGLLRVEVEDSPLALEYGPADEPVCHLLAGLVAGLAEVLLGAPASCREISCLARQEASCQFEARAQQVDQSDSWSW